MYTAEEFNLSFTIFLFKVKGRWETEYSKQYLLLPYAQQEFMAQLQSIALLLGLQDYHCML